MNDQILLKVVKECEGSIVGILVERGICEYIKPPLTTTHKSKHNKFENLMLSRSYKIKNNLDVVSEDFVKKLRDIYPKGCGRKGSPTIIVKKLERFLTDNPKVTLSDIYETLERYTTYEVQYNGGNYLYNLNNIFYKKERNKDEKSPFLDVLDKHGIKEEDPISWTVNETRNV